MLNIVDEFTRECFEIRVVRKLKSTDVIDLLSDMFLVRGANSPHVRRNTKVMSKVNCTQAVRRHCPLTQSRSRYVARAV